MFDRIPFSADIMGIYACIKEMRISFSVMVGQSAHGAPYEEAPGFISCPEGGHTTGNRICVAITQDSSFHEICHAIS